MNAQPAIKTQLYDGWVLRFSNGYTKRANSINPLYPSALSIDEKIKYCEKVYRSLNLPVVFKLTDASPRLLDSILDNNGYIRVSPTHVMTKQLTDDSERTNNVRIDTYMSDSWKENLFALNGLIDGDKKEAAGQMLRNIQNALLCGSNTMNDQDIACGLCVIERGFAGLFDIVVDSAHRGWGYGYDMCVSLLSAARNIKASSAYLQVEQSNENALRLYRKLGFTPLYDYWYRVKA